MKKAIAVMMLLAGGLMASPRVSFGVQFGAPVPVAVARPACPGPGYTWVDGYYEPNGGWVAGYWAPPPAVRIGPSYGHARVFDRHFEDRHFEDRRFDNRHFEDRHDEHFRR